MEIMNQMIPLITFLEEELPIFQEGANWIINQAQWVIYAAIIVLALQAWFQGKMMTVFGTILVGLIIAMFANGNTNDTSLMTDLSEAVRGVLGLD